MLSFKINFIFLFFLNKKTPLFSGAFSELKSNIEFSSGSYTPQFTWESGAEAPTVTNVSMYYYKFGRVAIVGGRFNITDVGSPTSQEYLRISMPPRINSVISGVMPACKYFTADNNESLIVRVGNGYLQVADGIVGDYSGNIIKTGYQGFMAVFMTN